MSCLIAIGGIPAVGKSTIVKKFITDNINWKTFKFKKVYGHFTEKLNLMIVGKYVVGDVFSGTDKLSMAVQPDFEDFLEKYNKHNILFEGDRLFNIKTLKKAKELINTKVYIIESKHTDDRHIQRNDNQSEKFIKGRITKIENVKNYLNGNYTLLNNDLETDIEKNYNIILGNLISK
tara:strand:+ start:66 stop:596 length:531 start_codon:yes stop_codon:yes gene_type:complete